eukprot:2569222-Pyramimonas_sp.AAC.3
MDGHGTLAGVDLNEEVVDDYMSSIADPVERADTVNDAGVEDLDAALEEALIEKTTLPAMWNTEEPKGAEREEED